MGWPRNLVPWSSSEILPSMERAVLRCCLSLLEMRGLWSGEIAFVDVRIFVLFVLSTIPRGAPSFAKVVMNQAMSMYGSSRFVSSIYDFVWASDP